MTCIVGGQCEDAACRVIARFFRRVDITVNQDAKMQAVGTDNHLLRIMIDLHGNAGALFFRQRVKAAGGRQRKVVGALRSFGRGVIIVVIVDRCNGRTVLRQHLLRFVFRHE